MSADDTALAWDTDTATCRSCHSGDATTAPVIGVASGSATHAKHVANATVIGTNYECAVCHSATMSAANNELITGLANHVNKIKNVAGTRVDATYVSPTCTASYCHSSGQAPAVTNFEYYSANWTTPTALDCEGCHGRHTSPAFTSVAGEPNYANGGAGNERANSHDRHVNAASDCTNCHNDTTATVAAILAGSTLHTDQTREVRIAAAWDSNGGTKADNYTPGTKTESIEGKRGFPRVKPPFPTTYGLFGKSTVINNVETLCNVPLIISVGYAGYRRIGTEKSPGPKLFCVSGDVAQPGLYETAFGLTLRELLEMAGGVTDGNKLQRFCSVGRRGPSRLPGISM